MRISDTGSFGIKTISKLALFWIIIFFGTLNTLAAQESDLEPFMEEHPELRERAVMMRMIARIVEQNQQEVWNSSNSRATMPGRPVGLRLVGSNLVVAVQFTPFLRPQGSHMLVAQGQIWINVPGEGMRYHTTMQTIPIEFGEHVYFFPLGSVKTQEEAQIEIQLLMEPYSEGRQGRRHSANSPRNEESPASP